MYNYAVEADPLPTATTMTVQNTNTVTAQVTGTSAQVQDSAVVIIIAAVLGSILVLILVGGAVVLITCLVLCRRKSPPLHKDVVAAVQGMVMSKSTETPH